MVRFLYYLERPFTDIGNKPEEVHVLQREDGARIIGKGSLANLTAEYHSDANKIKVGAEDVLSTLAAPSVVPVQGGQRILRMPVDAEKLEYFYSCLGFVPI